jgi:hypothetical protein
VGDGLTLQYRELSKDRQATKQNRTIRTTIESVTTITTMIEEEGENQKDSPLIRDIVPLVYYLRALYNTGHLPQHNSSQTDEITAFLKTAPEQFPEMDFNDLPIRNYLTELIRNESLLQELGLMKAEPQEKATDELVYFLQNKLRHLLENTKNETFQQYSFEFLDMNLINAIIDEEIFSSDEGKRQNRSKKTKKASDQFFSLNFDNLPAYEPLEESLQLLRTGSHSSYLQGFQKLLNYDYNDLLENPQWIELMSFCEEKILPSLVQSPDQEQLLLLIYSCFYRWMSCFPRSHFQSADLVRVLSNHFLSLSLSCSSYQMNFFQNLPKTNFLVSPSLPLPPLLSSRVLLLREVFSSSLALLSEAVLSGQRESETVVVKLLQLLSAGRIPVPVIMENDNNNNKKTNHTTTAVVSSVSVLSVFFSFPLSVDWFSSLLRSSGNRWTFFFLSKRTQLAETLLSSVNQLMTSENESLSLSLSLHSSDSSSLVLLRMVLCFFLYLNHLPSPAQWPLSFSFSSSSTSSSSRLEEQSLKEILSIRPEKSLEVVPQTNNQVLTLKKSDTILNTGYSMSSDDRVPVNDKSVLSEDCKRLLVEIIGRVVSHLQKRRARITENHQKNNNNTERSSRDDNSIHLVSIRLTGLLWRLFSHLPEFSSVLSDLTTIVLSLQNNNNSSTPSSSSSLFWLMREISFLSQDQQQTQRKPPTQLMSSFLTSTFPLVKEQLAHVVSRARWLVYREVHNSPLFLLPVKTALFYHQLVLSQCFSSSSSSSPPGPGNNDHHQSLLRETLAISSYWLKVFFVHKEMIEEEDEDENYDEKENRGEGSSELGLGSLSIRSLVTFLIRSLKELVVAPENNHWTSIESGSESGLFLSCLQWFWYFCEKNCSDRSLQEDLMKIVLSVLPIDQSAIPSNNNKDNNKNNSYNDDGQMVVRILSEMIERLFSEPFAAENSLGSYYHIHHINNNNNIKKSNNSESGGGLFQTVFLFLCACLSENNHQKNKNKSEGENENQRNWFLPFHVLVTHLQDYQENNNQEEGKEENEEEEEEQEEQDHEMEIERRETDTEREEAQEGKEIVIDENYLNSHSGLPGFPYLLVFLQLFLSSTDSSFSSNSNAQVNRFPSASPLLRSFSLNRSQINDFISSFSI